jgi:hypothetical protein
MYSPVHTQPHDPNTVVILQSLRTGVDRTPIAYVATTCDLVLKGRPNYSAAADNLLVQILTLLDPRSATSMHSTLRRRQES